MSGRSLLLFALVPLLDLYLLFVIGGAIGFWPTLGLVVASGLLGMNLARSEGTRVLQAWRAAMARGELPETGAVTSLLVLIGAALLIVPGVITDVLGLALLLPPTRRLVAKRLSTGLQSRFTVHKLGVTLGPTLRQGGFGGGDARIIDVDAREVSADPEAETFDLAPRPRLPSRD